MNPKSGFTRGRFRSKNPAITEVFRMEDIALCDYPKRLRKGRTFGCRGRVRGLRGESQGMRSRSKRSPEITPFAPPPPTDEEQEERHAPYLERELLRAGVLQMAAGRCTCSGCGRSPLVGERLQVFATRDGKERALCDLCLADAPPGEPLRMERVRPGERPLAVIRAAA
jgi:hypothetical protein